VAHTFRTAVEPGGKTATGLRVPEAVVAALGAGLRPAVTTTVHGHTYRTTVAPMGGAHWVPLNAANRTAAGVAAGDEVEEHVLAVEGAKAAATRERRIDRVLRSLADG
jgi:Domain of unknown function (DUF1905)